MVLFISVCAGGFFPSKALCAAHVVCTRRVSPRGRTVSPSSFLLALSLSPTLPASPSLLPSPTPIPLPPFHRLSHVGVQFFSVAPSDLLRTAGAAFVSVPLAPGRTLSSDRHGVGGRGSGPIPDHPHPRALPSFNTNGCTLPSFIEYSQDQGRQTDAMQRQTCVLLDVTLCSASVGQLLIAPRSIVLVNSTRGLFCRAMEVKDKVTVPGSNR